MAAGKWDKEEKMVAQHVPLQIDQPGQIWIIWLLLKLAQKYSRRRSGLSKQSIINHLTSYTPCRPLHPLSHLLPMKWGPFWLLIAKAATHSTLWCGHRLRLQSHLHACSTPPSSAKHPDTDTWLRLESGYSYWLLPVIINLSNFFWKMPAG